MKTEQITKSVDWAYPTSANAKQYGFEKSGCYIVETQTGTNPPIAIVGYAKREDAMRHARAMTFPWSRVFSMLHPDDAKSERREFVQKHGSAGFDSEVLEHGYTIATIRADKDSDYERQAETTRLFAASARLAEVVAIVAKEVECYCTNEGVAGGVGYPCAHCMASAALKLLI